MRVAIAEDDEASCKLLQAYLKTYSEKTGVVFEIDCFPDGMKLVNAYKPVYDLLLLDIEMPLLDGMSAARRIRKLDQNVFIIFITNMAKYAINGYEVNALDYFLKPVFYSDLKMRMERIRQAKSRDAYSFALPVQGGAHRFSADKVVYIESSGHNLTFHTVEGDYTMRGPSMRELEKQLNAHGFARCNTCYIVNLRYCKAVDGFLVNVNGEELQISRSRKKEFMSALTGSFR